VTSAPIPAPASGFTARNARSICRQPICRSPAAAAGAGVAGGQPERRKTGLAPGNWRASWTDSPPITTVCPVVVVADDTGSRFGNPLCLDSRVAMRTPTSQGCTRLDKNASHRGPDSRAGGRGVSYGAPAPCNWPQPSDVYPTLLDISGPRTHARRTGAVRSPRLSGRIAPRSPGEPTRSSSSSPLPGHSAAAIVSVPPMSIPNPMPAGVPGDDGGRNGQPLHRSAVRTTGTPFRRPGPRAAVAGATNGPHRRSA